jgi:UDP-GlcNAc:undecaprenyl-phosphate GlcNAc-1-phosphate transferase
MKNIQIETIILLILSLLSIFIINHYRYKISKITNLIDYPDSIRKFHSKPIPLLGGIMIFSSFFLINLYLFFFEQLSKSSLAIFISCTACMILGIIDDIKKVSYKYKFILLIILFYLILSLDPNLQINRIYFSTFDQEYYLKHLSIPFTILCLLLLINAINLIDGLDGLCISVSIIFITWLVYIFKNLQPFYIIIIFSLFYILYLNFKKNIYLGDSGSLFLGCLIGLSIILNYNLVITKTNYPVENIFITLMLPGLDMLRVFITRLVHKKNPFSPDRMHFHYILLSNKIRLKNILVIFFILIIMPILISQLLYISKIIIILIFTLLYLATILYLKKKIRK